MLNIEEQKKHFENHIATFTDYGNIKIVDFKNPDNGEYRIRFLFEEDYCKLHITGDLGELIASNYSNMSYAKFLDFVNDIGYFEGKIDCHSRDIYYYNEQKARKDLLKIVEDYEIKPEIVDDKYDFETEEDKFEEFLNDVLVDFDDDQGLGSNGYDKLSEYLSCAWEIAGDIGKCRSGILELYMLAFKLADKQLKNQLFEHVEKQLQIALGMYSCDNIDIVYNSELDAYCVMYHSGNNSFNVGNYIPATEKETKVIQQMCDKYNVGYAEN